MPQKKIVPPTASTFVNKTTVRPGVCNLGGYTDQHCFMQGHRNTHATMGLPKDKSKVDTNKISAFKGTQNQAYTEAMGQTLNRFKTKAPVPKKSDVPIMGITSDKNFIKENKENAVALVPPEEKETTDFLKKKDFGQVPVYLDKVKQQVEYEMEYIRKVEEEKNKKPERYMKLSAEEKEALRKNLIIKFEQINHEYQKITYIPPRIEDTVGLKRKRNYCESQLAQIEKYLAMLNKDEILIDMFE